MHTHPATYVRHTIPAVFTPEECSTLRATPGLFLNAKVQLDPGDPRINVRTSTGIQLAHGVSTDWIVNRLHPHILALNQTLDFDLSGWASPAVLRYGAGQHYAWHVDMGRDDLASRKLSVIVLLSDADAYEGGDLEWMPDLGPCPRQLGTVILFPSFIPHRVTPVTSGERFALVAWVHGDQPFR
ncbi:MAG: PKHD-type hydroxylase [Myxococcota bacterium]|jgi:PKHD-type hydroxylase